MLQVRVAKGFESDEEPTDALSDNDTALGEALKGYKVYKNSKPRSVDRRTRGVQRGRSASVVDTMLAIPPEETESQGGGEDNPEETFEDELDGGELGGEGGVEDAGGAEYEGDTTPRWALR